MLRFACPKTFSIEQRKHPSQVSRLIQHSRSNPSPCQSRPFPAYTSYLTHVKPTPLPKLNVGSPPYRYRNAECHAVRLPCVISSCHVPQQRLIRIIARISAVPPTPTHVHERFADYIHQVHQLSSRLRSERSANDLTPSPQKHLVPQHPLHHFLALTHHLLNVAMYCGKMSRSGISSIVKPTILGANLKVVLAAACTGN
jgi:hypothetical protein